MTLAEFSNIFAILAVQLRFTDADEVTIRGYFEPLKDLDVELVQMAAQQFSRGGVNDRGEAWFPKSAEWRTAAGKIEATRIAEVHARLRKLPTPLCLACDDTGWARDDQDRVSPCDCRRVRRLEVLGRRPMPALPEATA